MQPVVGTAEQRRHRRLPFFRPVEYVPVADCDGNSWCHARALDLSFGGIRIESERPMRQEELVQIRLDPDTAAAGFITSARIVHVQTAASGKWLVGCEFLPATKPFRGLLAATG